MAVDVLVYLAIVVAILVVGACIKGGLNTFKKFLPKGKVSEELVQIVDSIYVRIDIEIECYLKTLSNRSIDLNDIDDCVLELLFIIKDIFRDEMHIGTEELRLLAGTEEGEDATKARADDTYIDRLLFDTIRAKLVERLGQ